MVYNSNSGIVNRNNGGIYNSGNTSDPYQSTGNVKIQKELKELDTRIDILETNFNNYTEATDADIVRIENNTDALEGDINDINTRLSSAEVSIEGYQQNFDTVNLTAENAVFHEIEAGKYTFDNGFAITGTTICKIAEGSQVWVTDGTNSILIDYTNKDAWLAKAKTTDGNKFRLYENGVLTFTASGGWSVYVIGNDIELASAAGNYSEINTGVTVGGTLYTTLASNFSIDNITVANRITADYVDVSAIEADTLSATNVISENITSTDATITNETVTNETAANLTNSKRNIQNSHVQINASEDNYVYIGIHKFTGTYNLKLVGTDSLGDTITQFTATINWNGQDPIVKYSEYTDRTPVDYLYKIVLTKTDIYFVTTGAGTLYYSWDAMNGVETPTSGEWSNIPYLPEDVIADYDVGLPNRTVFFGDHSTKSGVDILGELNADWIKYPDGFSVDNFTVHKTLTVEGDTTTRTLNVNDDSNFGGEATFEDDVTIHGDLYVTGTTTTTSEAQVSSSGNYLVTRDNNNSPMLEGEYSGVAVNNYDTGKIATLTADHEGTWRVSDSATSTAHTYSNISAWNGNFYSGLSQTTATGPTGILTNVDADELASVVLNGTDYYHKAGNDWYGPITLVDNKLSIGSIVTDQTLIDTLDSLTKNDLIYYRSVTDKSIDTSTNQPLLTRSEVDDLSGNHILKWDSTNDKAIDSGVIATTANNVTSVTADQFCGALKGNADTATNATCSQYVKRTGVDGNANYQVSLVNGTTDVNNASILVSKGKALTYNPSTGVLSSTRFCGAFDGTVTNTICFDGCTYAQAKADIRSGLTGCTGTVTSINIYCGTTCKCGITTSGNICLGANAFNSTAFTTCTGTVTSIKFQCAGTDKCTVTASGTINLSANAWNTNATISTTTYPGACCTGTVTKVCVGTTAYSPSSGVISLPAYPTSIACADKGKNGSSYCAFGSNAFNSTAFTTCTGTVTSINIYCGTTCKCGITTSGNICLGANAFNSTAFTTCTGTVTKVCVGTTEYSPTSGVISLPAYPSSPSCVACAGTAFTIRECYSLNYGSLKWICTKTCGTNLVVRMAVCGLSGFMFVNSDSMYYKKSNDVNPTFMPKLTINVPSACANKWTCFGPEIQVNSLNCIYPSCTSELMATRIGVTEYQG